MKTLSDDFYSPMMLQMEGEPIPDDMEEPPVQPRPKEMIERQGKPEEGNNRGEASIFMYSI